MSEWTRYDVVPVPKPRMTQRDKWKQRPRVMRYRAFKDEVRLRRVELPEHAHVLFVLPMPKSWKRIGIKPGAPHRHKPDADNLLKALWDALYGDDSTIWDARPTKIWGNTGAIWVRDMGPPELPVYALEPEGRG